MSEGIAVKIIFIVLIVILGAKLLTLFDLKILGIGIAFILAIAGWIIEKQ